MTEFSEIVESALGSAAPRVSRMVQRLLADEPALGSLPDFGPMVRQGSGHGPSLIFAEQAGIELFSLDRVGLYEHRMALLAKPGDIVVVRRRVPDFERYLAEDLGLKDVSFVAVEADAQGRLARQCWADPETFERLMATLPSARQPLTLQAYMTNGHVWRLAQTLGAYRQSPVYVAGPAPRISKRANNKLWFLELARALTGKNSVPPTMHAFGPAAAAAQVARFADRAPNVVVKVPSSAGGRGNVRLESGPLQTMSLSDIRALILDRLLATGWQHTYPVLMGVWESDITASPSAQMWLPLPQDGPPRILGLFEQRVVGESGAFSGAQPAQIEAGLARDMIAEAALLGAVLQRIGYFGPCSLDAVIRRTGEGRSELHWIECNGRWSGVSIPLAFATGLFAPSPAKGLFVVQEILPDARPLDTSTLCNLLDALILDGRTSEERFVILSPPDRAQGVSLNVMSLADSQPRAASMMRMARRAVGAGVP